MNRKTSEQEYRNEDRGEGNIHSGYYTFAQRVLLAAGIAALIAVLMIISWKAINVLLLIFAGTLMAIFLRGLSNLLSKYTHLPAILSLVIVILGIMGIFALIGGLIAPSIADQIDKLMKTIPDSISQIRNQLKQYPWMNKIIEKAPGFNQIVSGKMNVVSRVTGFFSTTFGFFADVIIILIVGLFLSINPSSYIKGLVKLVPIRKREHAHEVLTNIESTLFWWLIGKIMSMTIIGILIGTGLSLLGIPLSLALGFIAGLLSFIPNIGPILSAIPAVLLALTQSPMKALYVVLLFVGIQAMESYLITPYIEKHTVSMPLALVIVGQVLMGTLLGGLGLVFATPLVAALIVLVKMLYVRDILGDTQVKVK
ncbi:MAG: AI-2E family transporter [wastewater metagenome]|nr:AI-2E family transporter [Candidatus Loosdrechtia aerotolerans]